MAVAGFVGIRNRPAAAESSGGGTAAQATTGDAKKSPTKEQVENGKKLFLKRWKEMDEMAASGDGLGPVYNARSCAECYGMVRPGGAGGNDHNVALLTISTPSISKHERPGFVKRMDAIDPALTAGFSSVRPSVTLHKFGNNPDYGDWRLGIVKLVNRNEIEYATDRSIKQLFAEGKKKNAALTKDIRRSDLKHLAIAQRNTPALFGAGLIDTIPNEAITALADSQAKANGGIKGKIAIASDGQIGKFGWRGHTATLRNS